MYRNKGSINLAAMSSMYEMTVGGERCQCNEKYDIEVKLWKLFSF